MQAHLPGHQGHRSEGCGFKRQHCISLAKIAQAKEKIQNTS